MFLLPLKGRQQDPAPVDALFMATLTPNTPATNVIVDKAMGKKGFPRRHLKKKDDKARSSSMKKKEK
jgi:hypothetical protein